MTSNSTALVMVLFFLVCGTPDAMLIRQAIMKYIRRLGPCAVEYLLARAEISRGHDDWLSAQTWEDIAEATARILGQGIQD
jgi:hypothetical protein